MNLSTLCYQTRQQQIYATPQSRVTPPDPYTANQFQNPNYNFSNYNNQLNMRRKAEVLSYKKSQSNGVTKKGKYSQIVNTNYRGKNLYCPTDETIPTPTSSCDVPGPIVYIYKDNKVPLYNFATNIDAYSNINPIETTEWNFFPTPDVFCKPYNNSFVETSIGKLIINNSVSTSYRSFSFSTPIAIYASGRDLINSIFDISFNMSALPICSVYFSNNKINNINPIVSTPTNIIRLRGTLQNTTYSAYIYYGMITVSNLTLYTEPGFVYDIRLSFPINIIASDTSVAANSSFGVYCNLQQDTYNKIISPTTNSYSPINCTLNGQISTNYKPAFAS